MSSCTVPRAGRGVRIWDARPRYERQHATESRSYLAALFGTLIAFRAPKAIVSN
jgi:hypothetical protein